MNSLHIIGDHAKFAPSAASRWLNCNASVEYRDDSEPGEAAKFGTEIHEWLAVCQYRSDQQHWLGAFAPYPKHWTTEQRDDAYLCAQEYTKHVPPNAEREVKLFSKRFPTLFFGTIDALWLSGTTVNIVDLKTGLRGISAVDNLQLLSYAVLSSEAFPTAEAFRVTIVQPRRQYVATSTYDLPFVKTFAERIAKAIESPPEYKPGSHCEFCAGRLSCYALHDSPFQLLIEAKELGLWKENNLIGANDS